MTSAIKKFHRKDIELMDKIGSTPFHAGFWCRKRIDQAISEVSDQAHGVLLDIGCGAKPFRKVFAPFVEKHLGLEYSPESGYSENRADFCGDAMNLPLRDASVDTILCTEVMEHLPNPEKAVSEFSRILRKDGTVIITAPFCYPIHDAWDFFRYSPDGIAEFLKRHDFEIVLVKPLSGTAVTLALLFNLYWFESGFMWTKWLYPLGVVCARYCCCFAYLSMRSGGYLSYCSRQAISHLIT
jgi:SAM-dependent methyltransferase